VARATNKKGFSIWEKPAVKIFGKQFPVSGKNSSGS
jgi:hypothetical protein